MECSCRDHNHQTHHYNLRNRHTRSNQDCFTPRSNGNNEFSNDTTTTITTTTRISATRTSNLSSRNRSHTTNLVSYYYTLFPILLLLLLSLNNVLFHFVDSASAAGTQSSSTSSFPSPYISNNQQPRKYAFLQLSGGGSSFSSSNSSAIESQPAEVVISTMDDNNNNNNKKDSNNTDQATSNVTTADMDHEQEQQHPNKKMKKEKTKNNNNNNDILIVFSDVDGTLVHYPNHSSDPTSSKEKDKKKPKYDPITHGNTNNKILELPASSTGMKGIISSKTISLTQQIRRQQILSRSTTLRRSSTRNSSNSTTTNQRQRDDGRNNNNNNNNIKFVLVSGMRTTTLFQRLPYLPKADAYCSEAGGRIFYPVYNVNDDDYDGHGDDGATTTKKEFIYHVQPLHYDGANVHNETKKNKKNGDDNNDQSDDNDDDVVDDLRPFYLVEDMEWRERMEQTTGKYDDDRLKKTLQGNKKVQDETKKTKKNPSSASSFSTAGNDDDALYDRDGKLWDFARYLVSKGFVIDIRGYSSCFRVNLKHQNPTIISKEEFQLLSQAASETKHKDAAADDDNDNDEHDDDGSSSRTNKNKNPYTVWSGLASSINLSCIDYYPEDSGKKNWYVY